MREDSGKGAESDEVEVVSPPFPGGPEADDGSGAEDILSATNSRLRVENPNPCAGLSPEVSDPSVRNYPATLHGVVTQRVSWEARIGAGRLSLHAVASTVGGVQRPGCSVTVDQSGGTCDACAAVKFTQAYRGEPS